jgi:carbonic anhydrase
MEKIIQGVHDFRSGIFEEQQDLFERLANSQTPDALFITCSDSRVNPNLITQTDPGELFILRNAGNIVPPLGAGDNGEAATVEYAVAALGVQDIIICGHSGCGAMKALFAPESLTGMPLMRSWLQYAAIADHLMKTVYASVADPEERLNIAIQENVLAQLVNLRTLPVVQAGLISKTVHLHAWVYEIETGQVFSYDPTLGQFNKLSAKPAHSTMRRKLEKTVPI